MLAPIVLFVYNRPWHTRQTVEALQRCELAKESELYIFADGPKEEASEDVFNQIAEVRKYIQSIGGFKGISIIESPTNKGLANSVIQGVSEVIEKHGKVIVVEDDIVSHPFFLRFMNEALERYEKVHQVFAISATMERFHVPFNYNKDVFLTYRFGSWGWATWKDRWDSVNWDIGTYPIFTQPSSAQIKKMNKGGEDLWPMLQAQKNGEIDSWAIRMGYNMTLQNRLCLRPSKSFVDNIGMDGSGIHCGISDCQLLPSYDRDAYQVHLIDRIGPNDAITKNIASVFAPPVQGTGCLLKRLKRATKRMLTLLNIR